MSRVFEKRPIPFPPLDTGALLKRSTPKKEEPAKRPGCGLDVTDWFIAKVAQAKKESGAARLALRYAQATGETIGIDARQVVEGGLAVLVRQVGKTHGKPPPLSQKQLGEADLGNNVAKTVTTALSWKPSQLATLAKMLAALAFAGKWWHSQEKTFGPWDFKKTTLQEPKSARCPNTCAGETKTLTFCGKCQENDVPGNIFYGHIGTYIGFSPTALLLGSNYANLQKDGGDDWDPPEDIARVNVGIGLPEPLTEDALCKALPTPGEGEPGADCAPCMEKML